MPEDGLAFVHIPRGHVYTVAFHNNADHDLAVSLTIDGISMFVACDEEDADTGRRLRGPTANRCTNF